MNGVDQGINLFDCANVYGPGDDRAFIGKSEEILGRALKGKRDDVVITSKVGSPIGPGPNDHGADSVAQLDDNIGAVGLQRTSDDLDQLNLVSEGMSLVGW